MLVADAGTREEVTFLLIGQQGARDFLLMVAWQGKKSSLRRSGLVAEMFAHQTFAVMLLCLSR